MFAGHHESHKGTEYHNNIPGILDKQTIFCLSRSGDYSQIFAPRILPNGDLRIEGEKSIIINGERQLTILSGTVRQQDITPQNTITSDLIGDAEISYKGKGVLANTERPGIFARIFDWIF